MESEQHIIERKTAPQKWKSCKLIIDPLLTNGLYKIYRFDGQYFNIPVKDLGVFPVETVRDPRIIRMWCRYKTIELTIPKFKIDEFYVGPIPPKEVTFARLNDNVKEGFLIDMCKKYGQVDEVEIFYNPKTIKHLGIGKVVFDAVKAARDAVQHLHETSVMGNIIHVEIDPKGENRKRYLQLLFSGLYTPWTLPVGIDAQTQSLTDSLPSCEPTGQESNISSPTSISTPLSLDTAYSSMCQDTPFSFGWTPCSQGTPHTPCLSGTPLSQDSCYSSLQATPVHQGEPSTQGGRTLSRHEGCYRKPARHNGRYGKTTDLSVLFKHLRPQPLLPLFNQATWAGNGQRSTMQDQNLQLSASTHTDPPTRLLPAEPSEVATFSLSVNRSSPAVLRTDGIADGEYAEPSLPTYHSCVTELPPSPSPGDLHTGSLDSRIEMLLKKSQSTDTPTSISSSSSSSAAHFDSDLMECAMHPQEDPAASNCFPASDGPLLGCTLTVGASPATSHQPPSDRLVDVSPSPLPIDEEDEEDETVQAVASLLRDAQSPASHRFTHIGRRANAKQRPSGKDKKRFGSDSFPEEHHESNKDKKSTESKPSGAFVPIGTSTSAPHPPPPPPPPPPPAPLFGAALSQVPGNYFRFPIPNIPPSVPPFPLRLPNGTIPFPPPGWIPPLGQGSGVPRAPPPIPPPPMLLGLMRPGGPYPSHVQSAERPAKESLRRHDCAPFPPLPPFNPFVPPPGYAPVRGPPHAVTVEKVLEVFMEELRSVVKKDIARKMVEGVAFKAFDNWWDGQEQRAKMSEAPLKTGLGRLEQKAKPSKPLIGQHKPIQLPSFKVKRKGAHAPCTPEASHLNESQSELAELEKLCDEGGQGSEDAGGSAGRCAALRRRHARPCQLDSDDEDDDDVDNAQKNQEIMRHKEEPSIAIVNAPQNLCNIDRPEVEKEMGNEDVRRQENLEVGVAISPRTTYEVHCSDSEAEGGSWDDSDCSSVFDSESTEGLSCHDDSSREDEDLTEEEVCRADSDAGCIVVSSDEDLMELETPATPLRPRTPGTQLELPVQEWSEESLGENPRKDHRGRGACSQVLLDPIQASRQEDPLWPHFGPNLVMDATFDLLGGWRADSPENAETLRPLTPTGSMEDNDPDLLIGSKPTPAAAEAPVRPRTPGRRIAAGGDGDDSTDELFCLLVSTVASVLSPSKLHVFYPAYQDTPKTPGREEASGWGPHGSLRIPATPGRGASPSEGGVAMGSPLLSGPLPLQSNNPYEQQTPRTPGRDIVLHHGSSAQRRWRRRRRRSRMVSSGHRCRGPPVMTSNNTRSPLDPCAEASARRVGSPSSTVTAKPLQGLDYMPRLLQEKNLRGAPRDEVSMKGERRRRQRRERRRRWMHQLERRRSACLAMALRSSPPSSPPLSPPSSPPWSPPSSPPWSPPSSPPWSRSQCEETEVLHSVWRDGLDKKDTRFLQLSYERLLQRDNGLGWLSDTRWIPHPLTNDELDNWQQDHITGSARSEGFYKISRKDKMKYLNNAQLSLELPSTSTLGVCTSATPQTLLRAGSDLRSEQRRLLSTFSCDSDLLKFNQLKFRKKRLRFARSHIHDWGLFALEPIAADELVIEYVGQTIRHVVADMREKHYMDEGIGSSYLFRIDKDTIIDATKCGNLARFINHSCNPNCYAKIITVESQKKIVIYSRQPIGINEEITYNYRFPIEDEKIPCLCGADSCRGTLN